MEKMSKSEFMRWVIDNHADGCTLAEDWDACRDAMGAELEDGYEKWGNPFDIYDDVVLSIRGTDGKWHKVGVIENQDMSDYSCEVRQLGFMLNRLGIQWDYTPVESEE